MIVIGDTTLIHHNIYEDLMMNASEFKVIRGKWTAIIKKGSPTDGATIPFPFRLIWKPYNPNYAWKALCHDCWCGQFGDPFYVTNEKGDKRQLDWKEAAVWFRDLMKHEDSNNKFTRRLFYHAILLKKRIGQKK